LASAEIWLSVSSEDVVRKFLNKWRVGGPQQVVIAHLEASFGPLG